VSYSIIHGVGNNQFLEIIYKKGGSQHEAFQISIIHFRARSSHEQHSIRGSEKEHVRQLSPEGNAGRSTAAP
jgi:hypothetical protein